MIELHCYQTKQNRILYRSLSLVISKGPLGNGKYVIRGSRIGFIRG